MLTQGARTGGRRLGVVAVAGLLALCACGGNGKKAGTSGATSAGAAASLKPVTLTLNFLAQGSNSGFMLAKEKGYYKQAGLDVKLQEGQGSGTTASLVANGNSEFGFADAPAAMTVRAKGGKVKIVAPILQTNGFSIMALKKAGISKASDLAGKTVAVQPGTAQASLLTAILAANGLAADQLTIVNIDPSAFVGSLLQGRVQAIIGGADAQAVQLRDQGADLTELYYRDVGVPTVGLSIIANDATLASDPDTVKRFVDASLRGWDDARKNTQSAASAVASQFPQAGKAQTFKTQLEVDVKLMCAPGATTLGAVPESNWAKTYDLLTKYQGLPAQPAVADYYSIDYLPAAAPKC